MGKENIVLSRRNVLKTLTVGAVYSVATSGVAYAKTQINPTEHIKFPIIPIGVSP